MCNWNENVCDAYPWQLKQHMSYSIFILYELYELYYIWIIVYDFAYRIIISSVDTALYSLSSFLQDIISISLEKNNNCIANSFDLYDTLSKKRVRDSDVLISLDISFYEYTSWSCPWQCQQKMAPYWE